MAQGRSILGAIVKNFINSLTPKNFWGELRGKDSKGVEYYEDIKTQRYGKRPSRWFVPPPGSDFEEELPVEWHAWLRHKRKNPPTEEEIRLNNIARMQVIENAKKLEQSRPGVKDEIQNTERVAFPVLKDLNSRDSQKKGEKQ